MGSSSSKEEKVVDEGYLHTNGLYSNTGQDYDKKIVRKLILSRKLAPFYKGLDDITTHLEKGPSSNSSSCTSSSPTSRHHLYADAVECPICFLYYPANMNYSKCCDQPICTECFVQMKRTDPLLPASCPFCAQPGFGIIYLPPRPQRSQQQQQQEQQQQEEERNIQSSCYHAFTKNILLRSASSCYEVAPLPSSNQPPQRKHSSQQRKMLLKDKPIMIVLVDHIRPGAATSPTPTTANTATTATTGESSLPLRRYYATDMTMETPSFEEWMIMEAVRRSLQDQQQQQQQQQRQRQPSSPLRRTTAATTTTTTTTTASSDDSSFIC